MPSNMSSEELNAEIHRTYAQLEKAVDAADGRLTADINVKVVRMFDVGCSETETEEKLVAQAQARELESARCARRQSI